LPAVVTLPVDVTVRLPEALAKIPAAWFRALPAVVMPKAPVLLVMVRSPAAIKLIPRVPLAGAIAWVRLLTLSVVTGGAWKSVPSAIPAD